MQKLEYYVWDRWVRVLHWLLALSVLLNLLMLEPGKPAHRLVGASAAVCVLLRLFWGGKASGHASLAGLLPTVRSVREHLLDQYHGRIKIYTGHSPLGRLAMTALMLNVLILAVSGVVVVLNSSSHNPFVEVHHVAAFVLSGLVGLHVGAAFLLSWVEGSGLVAAMFHGRKRIDPSFEPEDQ